MRTICVQPVYNQNSTFFRCSGDTNSYPQVTYRLPKNGGRPATEGAPERFGMTGHQRTMLYLLATYTGLRPNEIRNLTVSSFDFDNYTVNVKAAYSKRRREDILPLRKDTAEAMRELLRNKTPNTKAFDLPSKYRMADMIRVDLEDAGINWQDNSESVLEFYSLRHNSASLLAASGVNPKTA